VQFTVEKEGPLELLQFIQNITYNLGNSVPNIAIMLGFSSQLPLALLPVRGVFETKTDQELPKIWYEHLAVEKSCHTVCRATVDRWNKFWHCHWRICQQKGKKSYCEENCSFHVRNKDGRKFLHFFTIFPYMSFLLFVTVTYNVWVFCCVGGYWKPVA